MEESFTPEQGRAPELKEGEAESSASTAENGGSPEPQVQAGGSDSQTEVVIEVDPFEDTPQKPAPWVQKAIDQAEKKDRLLRSLDARSGVLQEALQSRSGLEKQILDTIRQSDAYRSTLERHQVSAVEVARNAFLNTPLTIAEEALKQQRFIERQLADEVRGSRSLWQMHLDSIAEESRRIRSMWDHRIVEATETLRAIEAATLKAIPTVPPPVIDNSQINKWAELSIGVGKSLSSVLPAIKQSVVRDSVEQLERFRQLESVLHPPVARLGSWNLDSVARFSSSALGFSSSVFSEIQRSTGHLGATVSRAVAEMERVAEVWEEWDRQMDLHADRLGELGWTYPMNLSFPQLSEIIQLDEAEKLDAKFVAFYTYNEGENLAELCQEIMESEYLIPWRPMLQECVESHKDRRFVVSATCLISVLEGAITKAYGGRLRQSQLNKFFNERIQEAGEDLMQAAMWKSIAAFVRQLFAYSDFSGDAPVRINRHWILHGKVVPTGKEADSLRLFQAIHTVSVFYEMLDRTDAEERN
jgi:hypothetical protein